jgi:hypothetical protein
VQAKETDCEEENLPTTTHSERGNKSDRRGKAFTVSDDDADGEANISDEDDNQSDDELFISESTRRKTEAGGDNGDGRENGVEDMDVDLDDTQWEEMERKEFEALEKKFKKANQLMRKREKNDETISNEDEVRFMQLQHEYERAVRKRKRTIEDMQASAEEMMFSERGRGHVNDDELFMEAFEGRHDGAAAAKPTCDIGSDDEDNMLSLFDQQARNQANTAKRRKASDNLPGDELVGTRLKRRGTRRPRQKKENGSATRKELTTRTSIRARGKAAKTPKPRKRTVGATSANSGVNVQNLFDGDVIRDAQGNEGLQELEIPQLDNRNREKALTALVASLPEEHRINARCDKKSIMSAMKDFRCNRAIRVVPGAHGGYHIPGMVSHLRPHQLLGTAFMRRRENDTLEPHGGIIADQMGLGSKSLMR